MFSLATKEAIKVGLAVSLSILLAFSFGWDRAYWSVLTVFSLATTESFSRGVVKAENRVIGTLVGIFLSIVLVALFPQDRAGFVAFLSIILVICAFMHSHKRFGYVFTMTFLLCVMIACVGQFNGETTFAMLILRIQENVLGVVVYSLVFRLVWPRTSEDLFFEEFAKVKQNRGQSFAQIALQCTSSGTLNSESENKSIQKTNEEQIAILNNLKEMLTLSLSDSPKLGHEKMYWRAVVDAYLKFEQLLSLKYKGEKIDPLLLQQGAYLLEVDFSYDKQKIAGFSAWSDKVDKQYLYKLPPESAFSLPLLQRCKDALKALSILLTTLLLWIYLAIPGAYMLPILGAVLAISAPPLPNSLMRYTEVSIIVIAIISIAQLVFIMPVFTEAWQIAGLYFFNVVLVFKISEIHGFELQKFFAGNISVTFGVGALQLVPNYDVTKSLLMVIYMLLTIGIVVFYNKLFDAH